MVTLFMALESTHVCQVSSLLATNRAGTSNARVTLFVETIHIIMIVTLIELINLMVGASLLSLGTRP